MSLKTLYYGKENISLEDKILLNMCIFPLFTMPFAIWIDFVPNENMKNIGFYVSLFIGFLFTVLSYTKVLKNPQKEFINASKNSKILSLLFFPFFWIFIFWIFIVYTLPLSYTIFFGKTYKKLDNYRKEYATSKGCRYRIESIILDNAFPSYICTNKYFYYEEKNRNDKILFIGKKSIFGVYYKDLYKCSFVKKSVNSISYSCDINKIND